MSLHLLCRYCGCTRYRNKYAEYPEFCDKHQEWARTRAEAKDADRFERYGRRTTFHRDSKWKKFAKDYLSKHTECEICGEEATEVHHVIPVADCEELSYDEGNLKALCKRCHAKITAFETRNRIK